MLDKNKAKTSSIRDEIRKEIKEELKLIKILSSDIDLKSKIKNKLCLEIC